MRFLEQFWGEFDEAHMESQELIEAGDSVLAVTTFRGKGRQSGVEVNWEVFQLWTLRDGKVSAVKDSSSGTKPSKPPGCRGSGSGFWKRPTGSLCH